MCPTSGCPSISGYRLKVVLCLASSSRNAWRYMSIAPRRKNRQVHHTYEEDVYQLADTVLSFTLTSDFSAAAWCFLYHWLYDNDLHWKKKTKTKQSVILHYLIKQTKTKQHGKYCERITNSHHWCYSDNNNSKIIHDSGNDTTQGNEYQI